MGFASGLCNGKPGVPAVCHKLFSETQVEGPIISSLKNATARDCHEDCNCLLVQVLVWPSIPAERGVLELGFLCITPGDDSYISCGVNDAP